MGQAEAAAEEWRPVPDWPYEVSNLGRIRRTTTVNNRWLAGRLLKPSGKHHQGRDRQLLYGEGRRRRAVALHRLVCAAFHGPAPADKPLVRHLDGNPSNNRSDNLAWGDYRENQLDAIRHGMGGGERNARAKLTDAQAAELRAAYEALKTPDDRLPNGARAVLMQRFGLLSGNSIANIGRGYHYRARRAASDEGSAPC